MNLVTIQNQIQALQSKYDKQFGDIFEAIHFVITDNEISQNKLERVKIGYKNE